MREKIAARFGSNVAQEIFSEYEESEDEKVRKEILEVAKTVVLRDGTLYGKKYNCREWIAWLEKQVQKPFDYECANIPQKDFSPSIGIEIPFGAKDSELQEATYLIPEGFHAEIKDNEVLIKKGKQKPAWSEEDERIINKILCICNDFERSFEMSSLSTKVIKKDVDKIDNWLKSLKQRGTWKPSEEQMRALHDMNLTGNISCVGQGQTLIELYNDLKKL